MDFLKSGLKSVLGSQQEGVAPSGAETVERLLDRLENSTLLADRRDACRALNALSKKYRVEVGAHGLSSLKAVLLNDRSDSDIVGYALNTLTNIVSPELHPDEAPTNTDSNIGEQFTEIFIKESDSVPLVISFLEEFDFKVLWPAVKLLHALLSHKLKEIQQVILASPMAVSKLMDLLSDSRDVIRNDALLLLIQLTKGNANLQKIVAFENAFDRLFDVINDEGSVDGGIVVEDCLLLMLNLLRGNYSNIKFFNEGYYIRHLQPMFYLALENHENNWSNQKISNYHCMLEILRTLLTPGMPLNIIVKLQNATAKCLLLQVLCDILTANGVPEDILSETINCLAEVIRGHRHNQEYLQKAFAPSDPPRSLIMVLMMTLVNEKQPFTLRTSVLYFYECFLYQNEEFQAQLIEDLLPKDPENEAGELNRGQLICGALFSSDALSNWLACVALSYGLADNSAHQENMLRVRLSTVCGQYQYAYSDKQPFSLLEHCSLLLQSVTHIQAKLGFLILLSTWLCNCRPAVKVFLTIPNNISYLISKIVDDNDELIQGLCAFLMANCVANNDNSVENFTDKHLTQIIRERIGLESYINKLKQVSKHEIFCKAVKHPRMNIIKQNELLLNHKFCELFKEQEGVLVNMIYLNSLQNSIINKQNEISEKEINASNQYKTVIRNLDEELIKAKQHQEHLEKQNIMFNEKVKELQETIGKLKLDRQEYQTQINNQISPEMYNILLENNNQLNMNYKDVLVKLQQKDEYIFHLENKLKEYTSKNILENEKSSNVNESNIEHCLNQSDEILNKLEKIHNDNEDLLVILSNYDFKLNKMKKEFLKMGIEVLEEDSDVIFQQLTEMK